MPRIVVTSSSSTGHFPEILMMHLLMCVLCKRMRVSRSVAHAAKICMFVGCARHCHQRVELFIAVVPNKANYSRTPSTHARACLAPQHSASRVYYPAAVSRSESAFVLAAKICDFMRALVRAPACSSCIRSSVSCSCGGVGGLLILRNCAPQRRATEGEKERVDSAQQKAN